MINYGLSLADSVVVSVAEIAGGTLCLVVPGLTLVADGLAYSVDGDRSVRAGPT